MSEQRVRFPLQGASNAMVLEALQRLQVNDVLREVVMLAAPMQVVCQESCRGICPYCGQNRNQRECDCRSELADDRWSKLRSLKVEIGPRN